MTKRPDNRKPDEIRPMEAEVGVIEQADGSAMFKVGDTIAMAGVYGPTNVLPRHMEDPEKAIIRSYYDLYPFSVPERKRPGPNRRSVELSMVIKNSVLPSIFLKEYPKTQIELYTNIIQANAGTRCAAISAASLALADAGIAMKDMVSSVAVGHYKDQVVVDINKEEEDIEGATDIPIAYMPRMKKITLLQLDGKLPNKKMKEVIELGIKSCEKVYEVQKNALKKKYQNMGE